MNIAIHSNPIVKGWNLLCSPELKPDREGSVIYCHNGKRYNSRNACKNLSADMVRYFDFEFDNKERQASIIGHLERCNDL